MKKWFIVDGNSVGWTAWHALRTSNIETIEATMAIWRHVFLTKLIKVAKAVGGGEALYTVIVWDGKDSTKYRREVYPDYKASRKVSDINQNYYKAVRMFREMVTRNRDITRGHKFSYSVEGLESDDLIAALSEVLKSNRKVIIYTGDQDLLQLLDDNVTIINPRQDVGWTKKKVKKKFGVEPKYLWLYKTIVGDSSDNWPGVKGIGPKKFLSSLDNDDIDKAIDYWKNYKEFEIGKKICKLPAYWLLEKVLGLYWKQRLEGVTDVFELTDIECGKLLEDLELYKISTGDLQYLR